MFGSQVTLFRLFGFEVRMDMSWVLLALLIAWSLAQGFFPTLYEGLPPVVYWWMGVAGVIGLFFSIVFHELSHSLVGRMYGLPIGSITLFLFGGVAEMEEESASPRAEFLMAIAGPIASVALAVVFYVLAAAGQALDVGEPVVAVVRYLALLNVLLAVFNMIPAYPLDGGRVLRAALWQWKGNLGQATRIASWSGVGFGYFLIALGILNVITGNLVGGIWWFLIGLFIRAAATGSYYRMMAHRILEGEPVRRYMTADPVSVGPTVTVRTLIDDHLYRHYFDLFPVTDGGRLVGCVNTRQVKEVPRERWDSVTVGEIAIPSTAENTVEADHDAVKAMALMQRTGNSRLMVVDRGRLVGIVTLKDMLNLVRFRIDLEEESAVKGT
jgi:Zn-dependent protease